MTLRLVRSCSLVILLTFCFVSNAERLEGNAYSTRLTDKVLPEQTGEIPRRPPPLVELGESFLESGRIEQGWEMPGGAIWNPSLMLYGTFTSAVQAQDSTAGTVAEAVTNLDLFANVSFTPTERLLIGFRPLQQDGRFTRYVWEAPDGDDSDGFEEEINGNLRTLYFEGDLEEMFPTAKLAQDLDVGFSLGRQPITAQDGMLIDDMIDAIGISRINRKPSWAANHRVTFLFSWSELNRNNLRNYDDEALMVGFLNEIDLMKTTLEADVLYVDSDETGDSFHAGLAATQRILGYNSTLRVLGSAAVGDVETVHNEEGLVIFHELSYTPDSSADLVYLNLFLGIDRYRSASRGPIRGGPMGVVGVLYVPVGIGAYEAALGNTPDDSFGGALGRQFQFNNTRTQLVLEVGGRTNTTGPENSSAAVGLRARTAVGRRNVLTLDLYGGYQEQEDITGIVEDEGTVGARVEWQLKL